MKIKNLEDYKKIRLIFIDLSKFYRYDSSQMRVGMTVGASSQFDLPENMTMKQACKVISYLSEKVEKEKEIEPASEESVMAVSNILEDYKFKKLQETKPTRIHLVKKYRRFSKISVPCQAREGAVDLITFSGDEKCFKNSEMYSRYFDWFTENVTSEEIDEIYSNINHKEANLER